MVNQRKKVLVVGDSAKEYALVKKLADNGVEVFSTTRSKNFSEFANCADIREDNINEMLKFVLENKVDITIASSLKAVKADISTIFQSNNQLIFSPSQKSAEIAYSRAAAKKFLYKLHANAPHFGIFDKLQNAIDYLKNAPMPQVIHADNALENGDRLVCSGFSTAKTFVEDLFAKGVEKIILEDYIYGHEFTFYVITDGYHAVPLAAVANYKFVENGDSGILSSGVGAYVPDYKISSEIEKYIMEEIVAKTLCNLQNKGTPYLGILGLECVLGDDNKLYALSFKSFLSDHDAQAVLNIIDDDILKLFEACAIGTFEDYKSIRTTQDSSVSCVVSSRLEGNPIKGLDNVDSDFTPFLINKNEYLEYETIQGRNFVLTSTAKTLSRARKVLYEDLNQINFNGIKYRTDICEKVEIF